MTAPPVVKLTVAYGAGLWAGLVFLVPPGVILVLVGLAVGAAVTRRWAGILLAAFVLGLSGGAQSAQRARAACATRWDPGPRAALVRLWDRPGARATVTAAVLHAAGGCDGVVRLRLDSTLAARLTGGTRAVIVGSYRGRAVFRVNHLRQLAGPVPWRLRVRDAVAGRIRSLYGPRAGLVEALVLGRKDDIDPTIRRAFTAAGLAHLLAISGLHVGVIAGWLVLLARAVGLRRSAWCWSGAIVWVYVVLLGFPAPATRAAGFISVYALARARQRHPAGEAVLAVAVLLVLTVDPHAATAVGAWLSVAAVWGTRAGTRLLPKPWRRRPALTLAAASFGATVATAPITAYAFGSVAPAGLVSNLIAVPLAGVAVPGVFASLVGGPTLAGGAGLVLAALEWVARLGSRLPGGHLSGVPGLALALPWLAPLGALVWASRDHRPLLVLRRRLLMGAVAVTWGPLVAGALGVGRAYPGLSLHLLDVGQGDAIAIRTPRGHWVLVDAGPRTAGGDAGRRIVVPFLQRQGAERLAALIVSHGDADHLGGVPAVTQAFDPELVLEPGQPLGRPLYLEHLAAVDALGIPWQPARRGDTVVVDSVVLAVVHPSAAWLAREVQPNENSVVVHLRYGCFDALLTGDIGRPVEEWLADSLAPVELLKVGHHGSAGGTIERWLDAVRPRVALISVGRNAYGHPAREVLERLGRRDIPVFRTDRGGTVTIRSDGRYLEIVQGGAGTFAERFRCRIQPLLRSSASSSSRSGCTQVRRAISRICSTTSPWPGK